MRKFKYIPELIKKQRLIKGISQRDLSQMIAVSVGRERLNAQFISNIERGICTLPLKYTEAVCLTLKIKPVDIKSAFVMDEIDYIDSWFFGFETPLNDLLSV